MATKRSHSKENSFENQFDFEKFLVKSRLSDIGFLFETDENTVERVPAHKMLLSAQSDVFEAMFYGELKEEGDVTVIDASIDAFKEFLQFFYLDRVELTVENVAEVMNLGHKYNVTKCVDVCVRFLRGFLNKDNICFGLNLAILYDQPDLQEYCETHIAARSETVFKSKSFLECDKRVLGHILQMKSLSSTETVIFEACMSWVKAKSKRNVVTKKLIQEHLGELFYEIRFTSMKMEEFDALSTEHDYAFTFDEYKDIMHSFASSKKTSSKLFNKSPRQMEWDAGAIVLCDRKMSPFGHSYAVSRNIPTIIKSNQPILLGILIFAPMSYFFDLDANFSFDVTISEASHLDDFDDASTRVLSQFNINLPSRKETRITLPTPVFIRPELYYEIRLELQNFNDYHNCYCESLMAKVQLENNIIIDFYGDIKIDNDVVNLITAFGFKRQHIN